MDTMSDTFRVWLTKELEQRGWSHGELARRAEVSRPLISRTLSGDMVASADFCIKIAQTLGEAPEKVLRLADILPQAPSDDDPTMQEIIEILHNMTVGQREEILRYSRYVYQTRPSE